MMGPVKKRPSLPGTAFLFFSLAAGCASIAPREKPEVVEVQLGVQPSEMASKPAPKPGGPLLRVLLRRGLQGLKLSAPGGLALLDVDSAARLASIGASAKGRLEARGNRLYLGDRAIGEQAEVHSDEGGLRVAGRTYAGRILLRAIGGQVYLINEVPLQDYLKGVLPSEVPASWPLEALKAQVVAARSYALWRAGETRKAGAVPFDLDDSVASQAYQGRGKQEARTDQAVDQCAGEVLAYRGKIAECFFHSNSGGHTAGSDEVWGGEAPAYLAGVLDSWSEDQPHYAWNASLSGGEVEQRLARAGLWTGLLDEIVPKASTDSGRWAQMRLIGSGADKTVKASAFRNALGADVLRSTNFKVRKRGDEWVFEGLGWGHGVGLSQEGAKAMAEAGKSYRSILDYYYPGTRWARLR
jgi:stage II sporulation protein D